jgi:hypothetical protein
MPRERGSWQRQDPQEPTHRLPVERAFDGHPMPGRQGNLE